MVGVWGGSAELIGIIVSYYCTSRRIGVLA